ncbi:MAG TPA: hypothetical protein VL689_21475 [Paraburkholderia sp.]|jgi:hypothetical protein|nr:hypothetical protein [Paraburkholderia sp.]
MPWRTAIAVLSILEFKRTGESRAAIKKAPRLARRFFNALS